MKLSKKNTIDYLLLYLLIMISGNPLFSGPTMLLLVFCFATIIFLKRKLSFDKNMIYFLVALSFVTFLQSITFSFFSAPTFAGLLFKILSAYFVIRILGDKFLKKYINIMYFLAVISLIIYVVVNINMNILLPFSINTSGSESYYPRHSVFGLYTIITQSITRNSGPFWEPGAFGGYLIVAYIFNSFINDSKKKKRSVVFLMAIITTMSTTVYFGLFLFLFFYYYKYIKNILIKIVIAFLIMFSGFYAFTTLDFLGSKIQGQYESAQDMDIYRQSSNSQRFFNILKDVEDFKGYEMVGRGWHSSTRYSFDPERQIRTVGLTDILVKMGIPFFIFMIFLLYRSLCSFLYYYGYKNHLFCIGSFVTILTMLMSEVYFNFPIYWSLLFLSFVYKNPKGNQI